MDASIVERITLEARELREGYELLTGCKTIEEMAALFCHMIRGNLGLSFANLYSQAKPQSEFHALHLQKPDLTHPEVPVDGPSPSMGELKTTGAAFYASLSLGDRSCLLLVLSSKLQPGGFSEFDKISIQLFLQLWDHAYQHFLGSQSERRLIFSLNHRLTQLDRLVESGIGLSRLTEKQERLEKALELMVVITNASRGMVQSTTHERTRTLITLPMELRDGRTGQGEDPQMTICSSFDFQKETITFLVFDRESRSGIVRFEETDRTLVSAITRQVHATLERDFLFQQAMEKDRMERELTLASEIQQAILPKTFPSIPGFSIYGLNLPSKEVSGDYFDCFQLNDSRFALVIADVSGKGFPAALLVSTLHAALHAYLDSDTSLDQLGVKLNRLICRSSTDDKFITFFIALLKTGTGELHYLNAGHNPVLVTQAGVFQKIVSGGMALGMLEKPPLWNTGSLILQRGDRLLLYTDGVTETANSVDNFFGEEALEKIFHTNHGLGSKEFVGTIIRSVQSFSGSTAQADDITLLYPKRDKG